MAEPVQADGPGGVTPVGPAAQVARAEAAVAAAQVRQRPRAADPQVGPGGSGPAAPARNEVLLVGRVAAAAEERALPSGDVIVTWRLVVDRDPGVRPPPPGARTSPVDTFDCVAWASRSKRSALALAAGDVVQVEGALRRRFWRSGAGAASRCEVEVTALRRLRRAGAGTSGRRGKERPAR